jgi:hypothetical protein
MLRAMRVIILIEDQEVIEKILAHFVRIPLTRPVGEEKSFFSSDFPISLFA